MVAAGLVTVAAPLTGPATASGGGSTLTCTDGAAVSNVLGPATGWTEFIQTDGSRGAESEGAIAYGGNLPTGMTVGTHLVGVGPGDPALVIAGSHGQWFNLQYGSAYVTPQSGVNFNGGGHYLATNPIDFTAAFAQLRDLSDTWGSAAATGVVITGAPGGNAGGLILTGTDPSLNVFTLTAAQAAELAAGKHVGYDVPAGATTIVNVPGGSVTVAGQAWLRNGSGWDQAADGNVKGVYNGIIWNFPQATSLTMNYSSAWAGHILAPRATFAVVGGGHNIGQVIAKSFTSGLETHYNLFPTHACVPGDTPEEPGVSDVTITKSASKANPHGGDTLTYTLTATNLGDADATGVVIRDELPDGVTYVSATSPCTQAGGVVTCNVGTLAPGASTTVTVTVTVDPIAGAGSVNVPAHGADHWLTPYHDEVPVDLEPGQQKSVSLSCRPGDILSDGNFRIDAVDQGTGTHADVKVLSSRLNGPGVGTWKGVIRNDAFGRAQTKAFIVCLPGESAPAGTPSHSHHLLADSAPVTATHALSAGRHDVSLTCRPGTVPIAPGYDLSSAAAVLVGSETDYAHRTWRFTFEVASPVTATVSVRCLSTTTSAFQGHTHQLRFTHVVQTVTVPGHTEARGDAFRVVCPDDAKGVVATFDLPPGVKTWGNDPQIKSRDFRLFNDTGHAKQAVIDLVCLHDRVGTGMGTDDPVTVVNTATVSSVSTDANATNNAASATVIVKPGGTTAVPAPRAAVTGKALALRVTSSMPGKAAVKVKAGGKLLAKGSVKLKPGATKKATVKLTKAGKKRIGSLSKVKVVLDPSRGKATSRTVHLS